MIKDTTLCGVVETSTCCATDNVPSWICRDRNQRSRLLADLARLVLCRGVGPAPERCPTQPSRGASAPLRGAKRQDEPTMSSIIVARPGILWPKEHGAYAELAFPLLTALALGRPTLVAALFVVASVGAFMLHEPLLVLFGTRGSRTRGTHAVAARWQLRLVGALTVIAGSGGMALASPETRLALLGPVALLPVVVPLVLLRRDKTAIGETFVAATFCAALLPVAVASGVGWREAVTASVLWLGIFVLGTFQVRLVLERARKETGPMRLVSPIASGLVLLGSALAVRELGWVAFAVTPTSLAGLALWLRPVPAKRLKVVGWLMVVGDLVVFAFIVGMLRG